MDPSFQDKTREDKSETISIEELIEQKRAELSAAACLTPVTIESFIQWKKRKLREKAEKARSDHILLTTFFCQKNPFLCLSFVNIDFKY